MSLESVHQKIISCNKCDRLRTWCQKVAQEKKKAYITDTYWGKPVPGFGDSQAELLIVGLAPAAHGANRTGRMFTGDNSGKWLYRALYEHGFSTSMESAHRTDSLKLKNVYITSIVHCAPPQNKPSLEETNQCISYIKEEFRHLPRVKIILALGAFAWKGVHQIIKQEQMKMPDFGHGKVNLYGNYILVGSYHPSQQNTFTGKLTKEMFDSVFEKINSILKQ